MNQFVIKDIEDAGYYFELVVNDEVIMRSELYNSKDACENGINSVRDNSASAELDDQTNILL